MNFLTDILSIHSDIQDKLLVAYINIHTQGRWKRSGCSGFGWTKVKMKFHIYKKQKSASVIFGLVRLIILRGTRLSAAHASCLQCIQKLNNKQSGIVIFRLVRLITL